VALARALVTEPQILLLDEPLSALDAHLVIRMQGVLTRLQRELGITFVYVTHSQSEAFAMADRVVIMSDGEISQIGAPRDIYRTPANRFVAEFVGRNNILSGKVKRLEQNDAVVATPAGALKVSVGEDNSISEGDEISFVIAADLVRLSQEPPAEGNAVPVSLISEEFIGSVVTLFLESDATARTRAGRHRPQSGQGALPLLAAGQRPHTGGPDLMAFVGACGGSFRLASLPVSFGRSFLPLCRVGANSGHGAPISAPIYARLTE
jgi:ABC-type Fe3+/spermidine/putrescine transport system ATPase subunit